MNHEIFPVLYDLALFWSPIVSGAERATHGKVFYFDAIPGILDP